ncbi:MAG: MFS transporter [Chitinivibrionales bacterium]|nr:MFS transporter [Chitinivibrionales bacterium]
MKTGGYRLTRQIWAWAMYDWANSAFVMTVTASFFPAFFKRFWCTGVDASVSTIRLGYGNFAAGLIIALLSPFLGALAGAGKAKKEFLGFFMMIGALMAGALFFVEKGAWIAALSVFMLGRTGFSLANLFYDSLLSDVTDNEYADLVSSLGYSIGYLGCGLLYAVNLVMYARPAWFGIASRATAVRVAFLIVGAWWMVFSIPLLVMVKQRERKHTKKAAEIISEGIVRLKHTFSEILGNRTVLLFLIAYWCYIDGVHTVYMMALDFGLSLNIDEAVLMKALLLVQLVGFPSTLLFGYFAQRAGTKAAILVAVGIYICVALGGSWIMKTAAHFVILACLTGVAQGATQALSRSFFVKIVPREKSSDYFGFYNLIGKFAVVLGPGIVATANLFARSLGYTGETASRLGISTLAVLFISGSIVLAFVPEPPRKT